MTVRCVSDERCPKLAREAWAELPPQPRESEFARTPRPRLCGMDIDASDPGWQVIGALMVVGMVAATLVWWWLSWLWGRRLAPGVERRLGVPVAVTVTLGVTLWIGGGIWQHSINERGVETMLAVVGPAVVLMLAGGGRAARDARALPASEHNPAPAPHSEQ